MVLQWRGFYSSANIPFLVLSFHFAQQPLYPNASGRACTLLYLLHQLFRHQFELLDLRESELTVHESSGFDGSANMTFLGLSFNFAR